ncbi:flagellar basal body rod protein FlgB [Treponema brennaborense]|uniref:Flagellar basal body rod protein FlgB n=1 Tax=Treponema brennaborense (strain DSM 12168 / CIP 105900 / DD5/3) TaxID=906968 RepID=F4LJK2_TREBD|nr:flagellar basal body rod protein FlgB [Treponema brennaborense]AEE16397.1 flagellar basal-body rod protein FlgB [Treponema brennaborense DSM 12168]
MNTFTRSVDMLHRAMDASTLRYQVSANNLANSEVPNFKRTSVNFESQLKRALESERNAKDSFQMITTDDRHIASEGAIDYRTVEPRRVTDYLTTAKANGNNVDAEQEAMEILKTQLNYQLLTQMQAFEFSQLKVAMKK